MVYLSRLSTDMRFWDKFGFLKHIKNVISFGQLSHQSLHSYGRTVNFRLQW